jgi:hypothetical protein
VLDSASGGVGPELVEQVGGHCAFGRPIDVRDWEHALNYGETARVVWEVPEGFPGAPVARLELPGFALPLVRLRGEGAEIVHAGQTWSAGERVVLVSRRPAEETLQALNSLATES